MTGRQLAKILRALAADPAALRRLADAIDERPDSDEEAPLPVTEESKARAVARLQRAGVYPPGAWRK
jgi:hypothetical protein